MEYYNFLIIHLLCFLFGICEQIVTLSIITEMAVTAFDFFL